MKQIKVSFKRYIRYQWNFHWIVKTFYLWSAHLNQGYTFNHSIGRATNKRWYKCHRLGKNGTYLLNMSLSIMCSFKNFSLSVRILFSQVTVVFLIVILRYFLIFCSSFMSLSIYYNFFVVFLSLLFPYLFLFYDFLLLLINFCKS